MNRLGLFAISLLGGVLFIGGLTTAAIVLSADGGDDAGERRIATETNDSDPDRDGARPRPSRTTSTPTADNSAPAGCTASGSRITCQADGKTWTCSMEGSTLACATGSGGRVAAGAGATPPACPSDGSYQSCSISSSRSRTCTTVGEAQICYEVNGFACIQLGGDPVCKE